LRIQKLEQSSEILGLNSEPKHPAPTAPAADTAVPARPVPRTPVAKVRPAGSTVIAWLPVDRLPVVPSWVFDPNTPAVMRWLFGKAAQLIPA